MFADCGVVSPVPRRLGADLQSELQEAFLQNVCSTLPFALILPVECCKSLAATCMVESTECRCFCGRRWRILVNAGALTHTIRTSLITCLLTCWRRIARAPALTAWACATARCAAASCPACNYRDAMAPRGIKDVPSKCVRSCGWAADMVRRARHCFTV